MEKRLIAMPMSISMMWKKLGLLIIHRLNGRAAGAKAMTARQENARQSLIELVGYFKMVAEGCNWHSWRKSEYDIVSQVAALLSAKDHYTKADFEAIALCINGIAGQAHANGSGWMDFQIRICSFFFAFGYETAWNDETETFSFR